MIKRMNLIVLFLLYAGLISAIQAQTTYIWQGADGASWQDAGNWSPARSAPQTSDILIFNSGLNLTIADVRTETIAQLFVQSGTSITLTSTSLANLTIGGAVDDDFVLEPGCGLALGSQIYITMSSGTSSLLYGHLEIGTNSVLSMQSVGCQTTVRGIVSNQGIMLGSVTGTKFDAGSVYRHLQNGGSVARGVWHPTSICEIIGVTTQAPRNIIGPFGNFIWNCAGQTGTLNLAGSPNKVSGDLHIASTGSGATAFCTTTNGRMTVSGSFVLDGGTFIVNDDDGDAEITVDGDYRQMGGLLRMATTNGSFPRLLLKGNMMQLDGIIDATCPGNGYGAIVFADTNDQSVFALGTIEGKVNVEVAKTGGALSLTTALRLPRDLIMTFGHLRLGQQDLSVRRHMYGSSASYVITDGKGMLLRDTLGVWPVLFPVGTAVSYNPATLLNLGDRDDIGVRVKAGFDHGTGSPRYVDRQWTISEATTGGSNLEISLTWSEPDENPGFIRVEPVYIAAWDTTGWIQSAAAVSGEEPLTATITGVTQMTDFGIGNDGALPVELVAFSATRVGDMILLAWRTATEANNFGFDVQRSANNGAWENIGFVAGHGTKNTPTRYEFRDPLTGSIGIADMLRYRLRQTDRDGSINYSPVVELSLGPAEGPALHSPYPLPTAGRSVISFSLDAPGTVDLSVRDISGREVAKIIDSRPLPAGAHAYAMDLSGAAQGAYVIQLATNGRIMTKRFIVAR